MEEKIKLFSDSDLDGVSCGILARIMFGKFETDITYCNPTNIDQELQDFIKTKEYENYNKIFITDLVIKESTATLINSIDTYKFKLFDHHKSNYCNNKYTWATVYESINGRKTCGAELFWNHLKEYYISNYNDSDYDTFNTFIEHVRLWDTWDWIDAGEKGICAKNLNTIFSMLSKTKFVNSRVSRLIEDNPDIISDDEFEIIQLEELRKTRYINQKIKNIRFTNILGYPVAYVFGEMYISELASAILKIVEKGTIAAIINADNGVVSLRANKDDNISLVDMITESGFNGGGHPLSAGFVYDQRLNDTLIEGIFRKKIMCEL